MKLNRAILVALATLLAPSLTPPATAADAPEQKPISTTISDGLIEVQFEIEEEETQRKGLAKEMGMLPSAAPYEANRSVVMISGTTP